MLKKMLKERFEEDLDQVFDARTDVSDETKKATKIAFGGGCDRGVNDGEVIGLGKAIVIWTSCFLIGYCGTKLLNAYINK